MVVVRKTRHQNATSQLCSQNGEEDIFKAPPMLDTKERGIPHEQQIANPKTMAKLKLLPEDTEDAILELNNAAKWRLSDEMQAPMITVHGDHYFRGECAKVGNDAFVKISNFLLRFGTIFVKVNPIHLVNNEYWMDVNATADIDSSQLKSVIPNLQLSGTITNGK